MRKNSIMKWYCSIVFVFNFFVATSALAAESVHFRFNQLGFLPQDNKTAVVMSREALSGRFDVVDHQSGKRVLSGTPDLLPAEGWGEWYYYQLDFTPVVSVGQYDLCIPGTKVRSASFTIGDSIYSPYQEDALVFMRQQRCGYNPFLDCVCHPRDGRSMYGPMPDSTYYDLSGGWHDAGDQLKYLITGSNATAKMLTAYLLEKDKFSDSVDAFGRPGGNGLADVLDEARWGLDWIFKMVADSGLFHQIADDRDHIGWKWPDQDSSDYGWGPCSYRVAYFATGKPQGLLQYKSKATGIANLAGRCSAAMALAFRVWQHHLNDTVFARKCLRLAKRLYLMGQQKPGFQQGNSYGAPYRYNEFTWKDDMEWAAAELFAATGDSIYLKDAITYALEINSTSWMQHDSVDHYAYYPFVNMGHFALHGHVDAAMQKKLQAFYQNGIERCKRRGESNPFGIGVPFIWCSNNLVTALITQILLYERMSGDERYHGMMLRHRDWLLGRNPWGTSMITGVPRNGDYPLDVHTSVWALTHRLVPGGLVDGPVYRSIYDNLKGLVLFNPDEYAAFQNDVVVYHDDIGDYSTNEPTMDGTADAVLILAHWGVVR